MLPTHGTVTSIFHLAHSLRSRGYPDIAAWIAAAGSKSSFLSAAIDHGPAAQFLVDSDLALVENGITPTPTLIALSREANRSTLVAIARLVLEIEPPSWIGVAVGRQINYEFVPTADLQGLEWLRPELDQLLLNAADRSPIGSDLVALGLGRAAELVVFAALERAHSKPVHVADISDNFGYDIETCSPGIQRWEVKGCTPSTSGGFHLSRNEFDTSQRFAKEWRLVQVQFRPTVLMAKFVTAEHISMIRELSPRALLDAIPPDNSKFYWETSARVSPPASSWHPTALCTSDDLRLPSLWQLGEHAEELRGRSR